MVLTHELNTKRRVNCLWLCAYLLRLEVEASRTKLMELVYSTLCSPEVAAANKAFHYLSIEFCKIEEQFLALKGDLEKIAAYAELICARLDSTQQSQPWPSS